MIVKILILLGLVKILRISQSVVLCSVIYGIVALIFTFIAKGNFGQALLGGIIGGALSFVYFWLLYKTEDSWFWWLILIGGVAIGLV
jgi:hypothetical protein